MNDERRKAMKNLHTELTVELPSLEVALKEAIAAVDAYNKLADEWSNKANEGLVDIRNQEEEAFENLSEGLQNSDRGQAMQDFVSAADDANEILSAQITIEMPTDVPEELAEFLDALSQLSGE